MIKELMLSFLTITAEPSLADDVTIPQGDKFVVEEAICLADNVYHEARNQPTAGQMAVISVTVNRVNDPRFPSTICEVCLLYTSDAADE